MLNKRNGLWNPDWIIDELNAYPVDDYVYMIKVPFHKPKFYQHEWDAFDDQLYQRHMTAEIVRIHVHSTSSKRIKEGQTAFKLRDKETLHAFTMKEKDYFKPIFLKRDFWGVIGFLMVVGSTVGSFIDQNNWLMWFWILGMLLFGVTSIHINFEKHN